MTTTERSATEPAVTTRYLLLADISGYTDFLRGVERSHGVDLSGGMPAGYEILGALLNAVVSGLRPRFEIAKLEGDGVFAHAPAEAIDGRGEQVLRLVYTTYRAFRELREEAKSSSDHMCTACPVVGRLDLKVILHRGTAVRIASAGHLELHGPAVNVAHRLLKNTVRAAIGDRPYLFVTDDAAGWLGLTTAGVEHREEFPDVGAVGGRVIELA